MCGLKLVDLDPKIEAILDSSKSSATDIELARCLHSRDSHVVWGLTFKCELPGGWQTRSCVMCRLQNGGDGGGLQPQPCLYLRPPIIMCLIPLPSLLRASPSSHA